MGNNKTPGDDEAVPLLLSTIARARDWAERIAAGGITSSDQLVASFRLKTQLCQAHPAVRCVIACHGAKSSGRHAARPPRTVAAIESRTAELVATGCVPVQRCKRLIRSGKSAAVAASLEF